MDLPRFFLLFSRFDETAHLGKKQDEETDKDMIFEEVLGPCGDDTSDILEQRTEECNEMATKRYFALRSLCSFILGARYFPVVDTCQPSANDL